MNNGRRSADFLTTTSRGTSNPKTPSRPSIFTPSARGGQRSQMSIFKPLPEPSLTS